MNSLDETNTSRQQSTRRLDSALLACLFLLALAAPVSIAATQTAWVLALLCWLARAFIARPRGRRAAMDGAVLAFVGLTLVSSVFSYEPLVSLWKMMSVSLVTIVYLVSENLMDQRARRRVTAILLVAGAISVAWTVGWRVAGKNLKVERLTADSPLRAAGAQEGDTIEKVNTQSINSPEELVAALTAVPDGGNARATVYRNEWRFYYNLPLAGWPTSTDAATQMGIVTWSRGRDTRAAGFYGHYTTYAEMLQLVASLTLGLLVALVQGSKFKVQSSRFKVLLAAALAAYLVALLLTVTRASWASFMVSASVIVLFGASRRAVLVLALCAVPLVIGGLYFLQQKRGVGFVDAKDGSTTWRTTVWREGFGVLTTDARHLLVGIGMDSLKTHWQDWKMFDNGKLPIGHMHSNLLQLAFERGAPTLLAWLAWLALYWRELWRGLRSHEQTGESAMEWPEYGLLLGALGGTIGFFTSGLVHYNWGDSEVVMVFYLLMGLSLATLSSSRFKVQSSKT